MNSTETRKRRVGPSDDASPSADSSSSPSNGDHIRLKPSQQQQHHQQQQHNQMQEHDQGGPLLLLICASGICACYLYFGTVQERVFAKGSSSLQEVGSITTFMLLLSCITNVLVAKLWIVISSKIYGTTDEAAKNVTSTEKELPLNHSCLLANAFTYFAAMTASNEALSYVSYPTAVLAKSSKLIPTMLVGFILERKHFSMQEWCGAALITAGITTFNLSRLSTNEAGDGQDDDDSIFGIFLLLFSLGMDGLLASFQGTLKKDSKGKYRMPSALECMLWVNAYAIIFMLPLSIWTGQFANGMKLFQKSQIVPAETLSLWKTMHKIFQRKQMEGVAVPNASLSLAWTILWLNLTAAAGQIFIFFTIQLFSPLMCTTITTTRKFLTILLSVWNFGHRFNKVQWSAIIMVFGGLYLAIVSKFSSTGAVKGKRNVKTTKND